MPLCAAYIVPHPPLAVPDVGRGEERAISATLTAYHEVSRRIAAHAPDRIAIISPHSAFYSDWIYLGAGRRAKGDFGQFRAPRVSFELVYDEEFRVRLVELCKKADIPAGCTDDHARSLDHGMMVPLYFLEQSYPSSTYEVLSIGGSGIARKKLEEFGRVFAEACAHDGINTVLIASGDLSHKLTADGPYGYDEAGPKFDRAFCDVVTSGDPSGFAHIDPLISEPAAECGLSGFIMLAGALSATENLENSVFSSELLSYEGPFGVGYGVAAFEVKGERGQDEHAGISAVYGSGAHNDVVWTDVLVSLARETVSRYVLDKQVPDVAELPAGEPDRAGCFVSIHTVSTDELRGCIGTIEPTCTTLAEEIIQNAISAATRDPRFPPIMPAELDDLSISVDVLFAPEPARIEDLDVKRYGVIVTQGFKRGLLLPDLDGVDTVDQQLQIACMKAGINPRSEYDIERFEVVRHV